MNGSRSRTGSSPPAVIGTGLLALDVVLSPDGPTRPRLWAGGTCGNVLLALSYLNWRSFPVARLRGGPSYETLREDLCRWGVRLDFVEVVDDGSTPVIVQRIGRTPEGEPYHTFSKRCPFCGMILPGYKPVLADTAEDVIPRLPDAQVFFFDRVSRAALLLAKACSDRGALVVFEPSGLGTPQLFGEALELAHVVKYSHERMSELGDQRPARRPLLVVETLGRDGLRYRSSLPLARTDGWRLLKAFPTAAIKDTAGAGDWCSAGLLDCLAGNGLHGVMGASAEQLEDALVFGQALAAWTCRFEGARGGMYSVDRERFLRDTRDIVRLAYVNPAREPRNQDTVGITTCEFCSTCSRST